MIRTTLNIKSSLLNRLDNATTICNIKRNKIIVLLLQRLMDDIDKFFNKSRWVKYQNDLVVDNDYWMKLHVKYTQYQYDYFTDMRKVYKCSVSLLLAYAIENYLNEILELIGREKNNENLDNYLKRSHAIFGCYVDGVMCWKLFWGIPKNLEKIFN